MMAVMVFSVISVSSVHQDVFAQIQGMSLTAQASEGSDTILVRGQTASQVTDITLKITAPNGNVVSIEQITPGSDGKFSTEFKIGEWRQNGYYTISASQSVHENSLYSMDVEIEVINEMAMETLVTQSNLETGFLMTDENLKQEGLDIKALAVEGSTTIEIIGNSDRSNIDVTLKVIAPNGNVVSVEQITPDLDGKFTKVITTGGPLWTQDGDYTVSAQQGESSDHKVSAVVGIVDGKVIPEFGTIAALILAIAIISIIAVSSKSRLSIMPRY